MRMVFVRISVLTKGFRKTGEGYCRDWRYPTADATGYDDESNTAKVCMIRCMVRTPGTTAFFLKGTQCGCSRTTSGPCDPSGSAGYQTYEITGTICYNMFDVYVCTRVCTYMRMYVCVCTCAYVFIYDIFAHIRLLTFPLIPRCSGRRMVCFQ